MSFCLPKEFATKFTQALKEGKIVPEKLMEMTSEERRGYFSKIVGEVDAKEVNAMFESKLLLKDQKRGLVSWAKKVAGISEPARRDLVSRIEKLDKVLDAKDLDSFLNDLASQKLGVDVSFEEAQKIADMSKLVSEAEPNVGESEDARLDYGVKKVALLNYVNGLKESAAKTTLSSVKADLKSAPLRTVIGGLKTLAGIAKSVKASIDNSFWGRQGFKVMFTNPIIWAKNFGKSWGDLATTLKTNDRRVLDSVRADVLSRPNAMNGRYQKMRLDVGTGEEAFPTLIPEKIPVLGRFFKASNVAFEAGAMRLRADLADAYLRVAEDGGVDLTDKLELESGGKLINSLTGRGSLGKFEVGAGGVLNTVFFSPKFLKAQFDFLTAHAGDEMSTYARKQAVTNLVKVVVGVAGIMFIARALGAQVETDPRSADFGKIRIGNTRFDITGGASSLITLSARLATMSSKSSTTGKVSPLNAKTKTGAPAYGATTGVDVLVNFFENKTSPAASVIRDLLEDQTAQGTKPTPLNEGINLLAPLPLTNIYELQNTPGAANTILAAMADAIGISTNTYTPKKKK